MNVADFLLHYLYAYLLIFGGIFGGLSLLVLFFLNYEKARFLYHFLTFGIVGSFLMYFNQDGFASTLDMAIYSLIYSVASPVLLSLFYRKISHKIILAGFLASWIPFVAYQILMFFVYLMWNG
ncbi:hypothetical protein HOG17_04735 [Candidatus Peregrinibacteria bacterium]|jgi:hypothetical protein|nr:hypothetical protein [Candidatus Peregrinibacteria bacterium]MBT4147872.1 hypothetical protein [Candidatus Peregrinibacteria bacterium]MBT4366079.1 hypothetical protein [Candidatus Peregrinibacteria bacterium]MBT4455854.1 hypothetical protein [Candidatus Peregrinibacteria bacterium]